MKRVLVTGATGFIGQHLLRVLTRRGFSVLALSRNPPTDMGKDKGKDKNIQYLTGSFMDLSLELKNKILDFAPEAAFHLAWEGIPDYSFENSLKNFVGSCRFFEFLTHETSCQKIVATGSCWEYGRLQGSLHEGQRPEELNLFAAFKTSLSQVLESLCQAKGKSAAWARVFFVYGPGQRKAALIPSTAALLKQGLPADVRNPDMQNDFIYVSDVANALVDILISPQAQGVLNIGSGQPTRVGAVVEMIQNTLGIPTDSKLKAPASKNLPGFWADLSKIKTLTEWTPTVSLAQGLEQTLKGEESNHGRL